MFAPVISRATCVFLALLVPGSGCALVTSGAGAEDMLADAGASGAGGGPYGPSGCSRGVPCEVDLVP